MLVIFALYFVIFKSINNFFKIIKICESAHKQFKNLITQAY